MELDALLACGTAFFITVALTPLVARLAVGMGAVDPLHRRGLARERKPLLGGLAMLAAVVVAAVVFLPLNDRLGAVLIAAAVICTVGAVDDRYNLPPIVKLTGQVVAALICVLGGVRVDNFTLPIIHHVDLGVFGGPLTLLGLVAIINIVNFSDGVDGLTAGACAIAGLAFAVVAFDLARNSAGLLSLIVVGAALGFLVHNFPPAKVFMGDCGSNLLGLLLGAVMVEGSLKTNALIALFVPLVVFAVPFLDTGFVIAKRLKSKRPVYEADSNHFHHRFARIGFSSRRTVLHLYAWTVVMAGLAVLLRFIPYHDNRGRLIFGWSLVMGGCFLVALLASLYLVYVLEILKVRRLRMWQLRRANPSRNKEEITVQVHKELETGEFPLETHNLPTGKADTR